MENNLIKQNINCLENPIWALSNTPKKEILFENERGTYILRSSYKIPEKLDMNILLYLLMISQKQSYKKNLVLRRYDIAKACDMAICDKNYDRIKDCLEKWRYTGINFKGTFYDNRNYSVRSFGIINEYKIDEETKELNIELNKSFLEMIQASNFCKYIDFDEYKRLKRPISGRLYEILIKSFYRSNEWQIEIYKLTEKLTLNIEGKRKLYPADIKPKLITAITEINKATELQIDVNFHKNKQEETIVTFKLLKNLKIEQELHTQTDLEELYGLLKQQYQESATLKKEIQRYYKKYGYDYVKFNILYTNQKATKAYISYLKQALGDNWGEHLKTQKDLTQQAKIQEEQAKLKALQEEENRMQQEIAQKQELDNVYSSLTEIQKDLLAQQVEERFMETYAYMLNIKNSSGYAMKMVKEDLKYTILHELKDEFSKQPETKHTCKPRNQKKRYHRLRISKQKGNS